MLSELTKNAIEDVCSSQEAQPPTIREVVHSGDCGLRMTGQVSAFASRSSNCVATGLAKIADPIACRVIKRNDDAQDGLPL